jgi:hypothetical protein
MVPEHTYDSATERPIGQTLVSQAKECYVIGFIILRELLMGRGWKRAQVAPRIPSNCDLFRRFWLPKNVFQALPSAESASEMRVNWPVR